MKKRILALIMSLVLVFGILPATAFAAEVIASGECGNDVTWVYTDDGIITISGEGRMWDYEEDEVPSWWEYTGFIERVVIEEGVTYIGDYAFSNDNVGTIEIPASVTSIGEHICDFGYLYDGFDVAEGNRYFSNDEDGVLYNKDKTKLIYIHDGISGFYTVADSVRTVGDHVGAWSVMALIFTGDAPRFENHSLENYSGVVFYPAGNSTWTSGLFYRFECEWVSYDPENPEFKITGDCGDNLTWALSQSGVLTISGEGEMWSFAYEWPTWMRYSESINEVVIEDGVTSIGAYAFEEMYIDYVSIPASVERIAPSAFVRGVVFEGIYVDDNSEYYVNDEYGVLYEDDFEVLIKVPASVTGEYIVPEGTAAIETEAFSGIEIDSIVLPETLVSIGEYAFEGCYNLTEVYIPANVEIIGDLAFSNSYGIEFFAVDEDNEYYSNDEYGVLFNKDKTELIMAGNNTIGSYTVPDGVETIADYAFSLCYTGIRDIELAETVEYIGDFAFWDCHMLSSITLPANVRFVSDNAFNGCQNLRKIVVEGDSITFSEEAFYGLDSLSKIVFTGDAPSIFGDYFEWPETTVYYPENNDTWTAEIMTNYGEMAEFVEYDPNEPIEDEIIARGECGDNLTWVLNEYGLLTISGTGDMYDYDNYFGEPVPWHENRGYIREVVIEEGVTSIGEDAFSECAYISSVSIPETVTSIGMDSIRECYYLREIYIPAAVEYIGNSAFAYNDSMTAIWVDEDNRNYRDENGVLYDKNMTELIKLPSGFIGEYEVPESVTRVSECAFMGCFYLTEVTIGENVTFVDEFSFNRCDSLVRITVDENNRYYSSDENGGLYNKDMTTLYKAPAALTSFTVPASVNRLGYEAFGANWEMNTVYFEGDAPNIDYYTFLGMTATIYYPENNETWTDVVDQEYSGDLTWIPYTPGELKGDVDMNGVITNADLVMVARYIVGVESDNDAEIEAKGDVDGNGEVNNSDLVRIARIIVGA
ncbi:MAG: hypothetical protein E7456_04320 [Ruminococcaceae bacterium]|nr:hypothetical protein [Oscillospiraceae bacterium]